MNHSDTNPIAASEALPSSSVESVNLSSAVSPPKKKARRKSALSSTTTANKNTNPDGAASSVTWTVASTDSHTSPLTSSRGTSSHAAGHSLPKHVTQRINQVLSKREAIKRDKASWLSSSPADHLPAAIASQMTRVGIPPLLSERSSNSSSETDTALSWLVREEVKIIQQAALKNGLSLEHNISVEALGCLLEQARKYTLEILSDAHDFALHRKQKSKISLQAITPADITLALEFRADADATAVTTVPCSSVQIVADDVNRIPLPPIPSHNYNGVVLPEQAHQLTAMTFDVVSSKRTKDRMAVGGKPLSSTSVESFLANVDSILMPSDGVEKKKKKNETTTTTTNKSTSTSYGAAKGKPIPVHLKSHALVHPTSMDIDSDVSSLPLVPTAATYVDPTVPKTTTPTSTMAITSQTIPMEQTTHDFITDTVMK